jgi:hypothetical protein
MRPVLSPAIRRLWRDPETLQLGRPPGRAVVVAGLDPTARGVLPLLDGTRDAAGVIAAAGAAGCPPRRAERLLSLLSQAGVLDDGAARGSTPSAIDRDRRDRLTADLRSLRLVGGPSGPDAMDRRLSARVAVLGAGRVGAAAAALLAAAGVGAVDVIDDGLARAEDCGVGGLPLEAIGSSRAAAARELVAAAGRRSGARPSTPALPALVVLAPAGGSPPAEPPAGIAHLVAEVRGDVGVVGPLVWPGLSACLRCLDLTRTDRDPGWPSMAVQLDTAVRDVVPCDSALAVAVAAQTCLQALAFLDGGPLPATAGGTLELTLPDWRWRRRSWQLHPDCGCGWRETG